MTEEKIKYALYIVLIEDTDEAYTELIRGIDSIETVKLGLDYEDAIELMQERAWGL